MKPYTPLPFIDNTPDSMVDRECCAKPWIFEIGTDQMAQIALTPMTQGLQLICMHHHTITQAPGYPGYETNDANPGNSGYQTRTDE